MVTALGSGIASTKTSFYSLSYRMAHALGPQRGKLMRPLDSYQLPHLSRYNMEICRESYLPRTQFELWPPGCTMLPHLTSWQPSNAKVKGRPYIPLVSINHHMAVRCHPLPCCNRLCPSMDPVAYTLRVGDFLPFVYSNRSPCE